MTLKTHRLRTIEQIRAFLKGAGELDVQVVERAAAYDFITGTLSRLRYFTCLCLVCVGHLPSALSSAMAAA